MSSHVIPPNDFIAPREPSTRLYATIYEGRLCTRRAAPTDGFYLYNSVKQPGKKVYIREYDHINGYLVDIRSQEKETLEGIHYKVLQFTFDNGDGAELVLEVPLKSELVARFAKCARNIDFRSPIFIRVFPDRRTHQPVIIIQQSGENVPQAFTKENPNGLPQWVRDEVTGEWDARAYWAFLFKEIEAVRPEIERCRSALQAIRTAEQPIVNDSEEPEGTPTEQSVDYDDIPF